MEGHIDLGKVSTNCLPHNVKRRLTCKKMLGIHVKLEVQLLHQVVDVCLQGDRNISASYVP